ncbi:hypothetical protein D9M71_306220 [compost metagenome]
MLKTASGPSFKTGPFQVKPGLLERKAEAPSRPLARLHLTRLKVARNPVRRRPELKI